MSNLWKVIRREYVTRVRKKSFILATLLTPLGLAVFFIAAQAIFTYGNDAEQRIAVIDEGGLFAGAPLADDENLHFKFVDEDLAAVRQRVGQEGGYSAVLVIPPVTNPRKRDLRVQYISDETLSISSDLAITGKLERGLRDYKIRELNFDRRELEALESDVTIRTQKLNPSEGEEADTTAATAVGTVMGSVMGFMMYISVFIYGMMVMRSVMEEKTSRIVEVIISSVRPFTLLLGKIIGVGLLGLTQVVAWMILIPGVMFGVALLFGFDADAAQQMQAGSGEVDPAEVQSLTEKIVKGMATINWWVILPAFLLYFLAGYFIYAALFAAVGSAMGDDMGESSSMTLPITIPVILAFYIMTAALQAPNSSLAVWSSLFPLFSPIVMPARLPFGPPAWQVLLSLLLAVAFGLAMVWLAGRIYRIGILNYGKKSSLREMGRWLFAKY